MPAYHANVTDLAGAVVLAKVTYTTYACDASGAPCAANAPAILGWRATWCVNGNAMAHAPVVPSGQLLVSEPAAYAATRAAIVAHYQAQHPQGVQLVP